MKFWRHIRKKCSSPTVCLSLLVVIIYSFSSPIRDLLHQCTHEHQTASHSADDENNQCHRSLYHNDVEKGCAHDTHLVVSDDCQFCDMAFQRDQIGFFQIRLLTFQFESNYFLNYKLSLESYRAVISSSRAPPDVTLIF